MPKQHPILFCYGSGQQRIKDNKKGGKLLGIKIAMAMQAVQRGAHRPMEHFKGFTQSHWMLPSVKCLRRITLMAAMVKEFKSNTQTLSKHNF